MSDRAIHILSWPQASREAAAIRTEVFVVEQGVAQDIELDEWDERCEHAIAYDASGAAVGTGRLLPDGHVGRMAVLREARGKGVGGDIMRALLERAREHGMRRIELSAQVHAVGFYERYGFAAYGEEYVEAGIAHVRMMREL